MQRTKIKVDRAKLIAHFQKRLKVSQASFTKEQAARLSECVRRNLEHLDATVIDLNAEIDELVGRLKAYKAARPKVSRGEKVKIYRHPRSKYCDHVYEEVREARHNEEADRLKRAITTLGMATEDEIVVTGTEYERLM